MSVIQKNVRSPGEDIPMLEELSKRVIDPGRKPDQNGAPDAMDWWHDFMSRKHVGSEAYSYKNFWFDLGDGYKDLEIQSARMRFYFDRQPEEVEITNVIHEAVKMARAMEWDYDRGIEWVKSLNGKGLRGLIQAFNDEFGFYQTYPERESVTDDEIPPAYPPENSGRAIELPEEYKDLDIRSLKLREYYDQVHEDEELGHVIWEARNLTFKEGWNHERRERFLKKLARSTVYDAIDAFNKKLGHIYKYPQRKKWPKGENPFFDE